MKSTLKIIGLLALFAVATPCVLSADKSDAKAETGKAKNKYSSFYQQVDSVTATLLTLKAGPETKFVINADTKITKDKAKKEAGTVADVKVGQWVGGSYTKEADGNVLHALHLGVSQDGPKGKKKAK